MFYFGIILENIISIAYNIYYSFNWDFLNFIVINVSFFFLLKLRGFFYIKNERIFYEEYEEDENDEEEDEDQYNDVDDEERAEIKRKKKYRKSLVKNSLFRSIIISVGWLVFASWKSFR